jgi:hypothetical protein
VNIALLQFVRRDFVSFEGTMAAMFKVDKNKTFKPKKKIQKGTDCSLPSLV